MNFFDDIADYYAKSVRELLWLWAVADNRLLVQRRTTYWMQKC